MFVNTGFSLNNIRGEDMYGLMVVRTGGGVIEQNFGISRKPVIDEVRYKSRKYFYRNENEVYTFKVQFAKKGIWTYEQRAEVSRWFYPDGYKIFTTDDYPLEFNVMATDSKFYNASNDYGYLDISFDCDQAYGYSPTAISDFDLSSNVVGGTIIEIFNNSNVPEFYNGYAPEIQFTMSGDTAITFTNLSNSNKVMGFTALGTGETIYTNGEFSQIVSNVSNNRYSNMSGDFLQLVYGKNRINVVGKSLITIRAKYPMMV